MSDTMTFEARLDDAFERYLADAPVDVDAAAVAAHVASTDRDRRFGLFPGVSARRRQVAIALAVGLLVLAFAATALFLVGRLQHRPSLPLSYRNQLVAAPNLLVPRAFSEAVTLLDGRVLIVGGNDAFAPTAEVFDPTDGSVRTTGKLVGAGNLTVGRMTLLRDGRVLLLATDNPGYPVNAIAQIFEPATLEFHAVGRMGTPRADAWLGALGDGRVLVIGGSALNRGSGAPDMEVEAFDPQNETFSNVGMMPHSQADYPNGVTALPDGRVVVIVKVPVAGQPAGTYTPGLAVFDPRTNRFSESGLAIAAAQGWRIPANASAAVLADGRLFFVGEAVAADGSATEGGATIWDPRTDTFVEGLVAAPYNPSRVLGLDDGRVFMIGPADPSNDNARGARTFDPRAGVGAVVGPLSGCLPEPVRLIDGRVLLIGGMEDCGIHNPELGGQLAPAVPAMQIFE